MLTPYLDAILAIWLLLSCPGPTGRTNVPELKIEQVEKFKISTNNHCGKKEVK